MSEPLIPKQYEGYSGYSWVSTAELEILIKLLPDNGIMLENR